MRVTHLGHSTILVQTGTARILIDPGVMSTAWHDLAEIDAVFVTHPHPDHLDQRNAPALSRTNPTAAWFVEPSVLELLPDGVSATALGADTELSVGDLPITTVGGQHAVIHPDLPGVGNIGLILGGGGEPRLFHPGDSYDAVPDGIDVLALPLQAPWAALRDTVEFARGVGAATIIPIHDRLVTQAGRALYLARTGELVDSDLLELPEGGAFEF